MKSNYPERIEDMRLATLAISEQLETVREKLGKIKDDVTANVAMECGPDGKPLYSNETKRAAAVAAYLADLDEYQELEARARALRHDLELRNAKLERLRNEFADEKLARREQLAAVEAAA